jgi:hypothetical protein
VISEQGSALAYAVTEGVRLGSRTTYAAPRQVPSLTVSRVELTQELRLKVQVPTGTGYIQRVAKQILRVPVLGKPQILLVGVLVMSQSESQVADATTRCTSNQSADGGV